MEDEESIYDSFYVIFNDLVDKYGDLYASYINTSLLNVILVVGSARNACIIDRIRNNNALLSDLLDIIKDYYPLSIIKLTDVEFLVYMTINKNYINETMKHNMKEYNINMGKVLGYCYTKSDFSNTNIDRVAVYYMVKSKISNSWTELFITVIPLYAYNESIKQCIDDNVKLFNSVLINLDYTVSTKIKHI